MNGIGSLSVCSGAEMRFGRVLLKISCFRSDFALELRARLKCTRQCVANGKYKRVRSPTQRTHKIPRPSVGLIKNERLDRSRRRRRFPQLSYKTLLFVAQMQL
jgi:hypothetical protein